MDWPLIAETLFRASFDVLDRLPDDRKKMVAGRVHEGAYDRLTDNHVCSQESKPSVIHASAPCNPVPSLRADWIRRAGRRSLSPMLDLSRRRFLVALAVTLAGLGIRRGVARPVRIQPPPLIKPEPWVPMRLRERKPQELCADGVWIEDGGHRTYHPGRGWIHSFRPMRPTKIASWYGPPPPYGQGVKDYGNGSILVRPERKPLPPGLLDPAALYGPPPPRRQSVKDYGNGLTLFRKFVSEDR